MLRLRVRLVNDNGTTDSTSRVLDTTRIEYGTMLNGTPTLSFTVGRDSFVPTQYPFVVRVEYSWNGEGYTVLPHNSHFIIEEDGDDSKDTAQLATYTGIGFVPWLLAGALVPWNDNHKDYTRTWVETGRNDASAGWILAGVLGETKTAGWFPMLTWNFTNTQDSAGIGWVNSEKVNIPWDYSKNIADILGQLTDDSLCDWTTTGTQLNVFKFNGLKRDRTEYVLGGPGFESVPVKIDSSNQYSHVRAAPEELPWQNHYLSPTIRSRFGHRSIMVSQSGVKDVATSNKLIQPYLEAGASPIREESYIWTPVALAHNGTVAAEVVPFKDFRVGDQVTAISRGGKEQRRVVGLVITDEDGPATVRAVVGERIGKKSTKLRDKLLSGVAAGEISGSGSSFPATAGPSPLKPKAPLGLTVTSNTSRWVDLGTPEATVELDWANVTDAEDDSESLVVQYEVWSRRPSESLSLDTATNESKAVISSWVPGEPRHVAVRAQSDKGRWSNFSTEILVTPDYPSAIVPKAPGQPTVVSNVGTFTSSGPVAEVNLTIPAVTESVDDEPVEIAEYEVYVDNIPAFRTPTTAIKVHVPSGVTQSVRARAVTTLGVWSDLSTARSVTGALPSTAARAPSAPILDSAAGLVVARWDGTYAGGGTSGAHTVVVERYNEATLAWVREGVALNAAGSVSFRRPSGEEVDVRFRAYDALGRLTGTSGTETVEVVGVEMVDLDTAVQDFITQASEDASEALTTAGGMFTWSTAAPVPADAVNKPIGATWFRTSGATIIGQWELTTGGWASRQVANDAIASLNASKINAGTIAAARIGAKSITVDKLVVGDTENLILDPDFGTAAMWTVNANREILARSAAGVPANSPALTRVMRVASTSGANNDLAYQTPRIPVSPGDKFFVEYWIARSTDCNSTFRAFIASAANGSTSNSAWPSATSQTAANVPANTWVKVNGVITVPEGHTSVVLSFGSMLTASPAGNWYLATPIYRRMTKGELIVDGAIRANHVEMDTAFADKFWANEANFGKIGVDFLEPNVGDVLSISANESIVFMAGRQDEIEGAALHAQEAADDAQLAATNSLATANNASAKADTANDAALTAQASAAAVGQALQDHQAVFIVDAQGAVIASVDRTNELRMRPTYVAIAQNGQEVTRWEANRMIVNEIELNRARVAGHTIEPYGTGTVFKSLT